MTFLHWICEEYLQKRRKRSKKKTINQYWRDFKMLYRHCNNGRVVNPNDCEEIRKVLDQQLYFPAMPPYADITKYINATLKEKFQLDDQPATKPVMSVDDLFLGLTHHWSRDRSIFPTEDDRLDLPTIMLFQAYTACRPAELVDGTKCRGATDPLFDDSVAKDPGCDRAVNIVTPPAGTRQRSKSGRFETNIGRKRRASVESESDFESDADSDYDEPIFDSGDDTSDTDYSDDADADVDMLQENPESYPSRIPTWEGEMY
jgi:hypothetical protein